MALTGAGHGANTNITAGTTFAVVPTVNLTAGAMAVLVVAADNAAANGIAFATFSVTDTKGNTWTKRQDALYDPGAASAGVEVGIFTTPQNGGALLTTDTITVSFGSDTVTAKAWTLQSFTPGAGNGVGYVTGAVGTGAGTASPTITTSSIPTGDAVVGVVGAENTATSASPWTGDADSTNGSWSGQQTAGVTASTSGISITAQRKIVTGTGTQTYNPTASGTPDCIPAWIQITELIAITGTGNEGLAAVALAVAALETFTGTANQGVTAVALAVAGKETFTGTGNEGLAAVALAVAGKETFTGTGNEGVAAVALSVAAKETFTGTGNEGVGAVALAVTGTEGFAGTGAVALSAVALSAAGLESFIASGAFTVGAVALEGHVVIPPVTGTGGIVVYVRVAGQLEELTLESVRSTRERLTPYRRGFLL